MRRTGALFAPTDSTLRQFAGLWLLAFGGLAAWHGLARGHGRIGVALAAMAATIGGLGLARPRAVRPIFVGWMVLASPVGWLTSTILLAVVYYGLIAPVGLAMRAAGRDELRLRRRPGQGSYWQPRPGPAPARGYFRQF